MYANAAFNILGYTISYQAIGSMSYFAWSSPTYNSHITSIYNKTGETHKLQHDSYYKIIFASYF